MLSKRKTASSPPNLNSKISNQCCEYAAANSKWAPRQGALRFRKLEYAGNIAKTVDLVLFGVHGEKPKMFVYLILGFDHDSIQ